MGTGIREATSDDRDAVVRLVHLAFRTDPVSMWIFPDLEECREVHSAFLGVYVDLALAVGRVDVTEDGSAAAVWFQIPAEGVPADPETMARLTAIVGPHNQRAPMVGRLADAAHPHGRAHEYLQFIAVSPERQGEGLGTALLTPALERCDREGIPAYLEASNTGSRMLYERLGFVFTGHLVELPEGPRMWPMWREPRTD